MGDAIFGFSFLILCPLNCMRKLLHLPFHLCRLVDTTFMRAYCFPL
jgi:hypothetical protein